MIIVSPKFFQYPPLVYILLYNINYCSGDAHSALGNYDQAKKYYITAVKLRDTLPKMRKAICYRIITKIYCKMDPPRYSISEESRQNIIKKLELASYLRRLCVAYMVCSDLLN